MRALLLLIPLAIACNDDPKVKITQSTSETFEQVTATSADILWIVDNSISMEQEQFKVMDGAARFINTFEAADIDFHLGVATTDVSEAGAQAGVMVGDTPYLTAADADYVEQFQDRVDVGIFGDDQESGLEAAVLALTEPNVSTVNAGFLRDDARLSVIVLSDEDDCSDFGTLFDADSDSTDCLAQYEELSPVQDVVEQLQALKSDRGQVQFSGIIGPRDLICTTAAPGDRYTEAVESTGGVAGNICAANYSSIMEQLGLVAGGIQYQWELTYDAVESSLEVWILPADGADYEVFEDEEDGWTFEADPPTLTLHGDAVPPRGASLQVSYSF